MLSANRLTRTRFYIADH